MCLLDYPYFEEYYNLITIDLSKEQKLDADTKATQEIAFTGYSEEDNAAMFFIIEEAKEAKLDFHLVMLVADSVANQVPTFRITYKKNFCPSCSLINSR